jgi:hypothetical protein
MQAGQWLPLTDYASKYRISVSTLRRRIKGGQIEFRFDDGKYWILDTDPQNLDQRQPVLGTDSGAETHSATRAAPLIQEAQGKLDQLRDSSGSGTTEEPIFSSASRLLNELKRAYMSILHEKEEQIIQLKEEVSDLKTLVRVLEDDNERLRKILGLQSPNINN